MSATVDTEQVYQCHMALVRCPNIRTTGWIPARAAKVGLKVELLPDKEWWEVVYVYTETPQGLTKLKERERINRKGLPSIRDTKKDQRHG